MIGKLVVSLFVILCVLHRIDAACYIYPCDDKVSDAKCTNTTDYWISKSNLSKAKYCECCMNPIIKPGMTSYPNPYGPDSTLTNSTRPFNSTRPSNSSSFQPTGKPAFNSSTQFKDLENTLHSSRKGFSFHDSTSASKIKILKSNSTRMNKKLTDNSISKFFGLY